LADSPQKTRKAKSVRKEEAEEATTQVKLLCRGLVMHATEGNKEPKKQRRKTSITFQPGVAITNDYVDCMEKAKLQEDERVKEGKAKLAKERKEKKTATVQKHQLELSA
jgi:hypothetical protein